MKHISTFENFLNEADARVKSLGSKKLKIVTEAYTESQVERLLNMDAIDISIDSDKVTVVVSGNDLGYDDDQYYEISWYPSDKRVDSGTFKDPRRTKMVTGNEWSEDVKSLEDFADVVNGDADGSWM